MTLKLPTITIEKDKLIKPEILGIEMTDYAFSTDMGFDFWIENDLTRYARERGVGKKLLGWTVYVISKDGQPIERILFNKNNKPIYSTKVFGQMVFHIDALRIAMKKK